MIELPCIAAEAGDEAERLRVLAAHHPAMLDGAAALRQITDFAARLCDVPTALVSLVDDHRQFFLARTGLDVAETPREQSFCAHAMWERVLMVVPDARDDLRFADNPLVTGEMGLRFYAGMPLISEDGYPLGSLCVIDTKPRPEGLTELQREGLAVLAHTVMARLTETREGIVRRDAERAARRAATDSETRFRTLADTMPQMVWSTLPDGYHDYYNARWYEFTGAPAGTTDGEGWNDMFHAEDQERAWTVWRHSLETGDPYQIEYRLRHHDGTYRWVLGRALPIRNADGRITRWFGTCTDIHEQKLAIEEREVISQELSHRIKNIFSVIAGLIQFAARTHPEAAGVAHDLRQRITALGRAHDFVRPHSPQSRPSAQQDSLHGLLGELFLPYRRDDGERVRVSGDDVAVDDRAATPLALLFHELATNASKYGALSVLDGWVDLSVARTGEVVTLTWAERDGPAVSAPPDTQAGFGSQLIEMSAVRQLGGSVARDWKPAGLVVTIEVPVPAFSRVSAT